ncbi:translation initiation factor IF-2-like [Hemicordylus capensis]|uniref:translation initiation factor IF-2-like n=1 Tax=Hemicordylus capensis TaxID=884348 RepID=UPI002304C897|nr:translation initiation factor IF-2-like [Hemicordylus capensis]
MGGRPNTPPRTPSAQDSAPSPQTLHALSGPPARPCGGGLLLLLLGDPPTGRPPPPSSSSALLTDKPGGPSAFPTDTERSAPRSEGGHEEGAAGPGDPPAPWGEQRPCEAGQQPRPPRQRRGDPRRGGLAGLGSVLALLRPLPRPACSRSPEGGGRRRRRRDQPPPCARARGSLCGGEGAAPPVGRLLPPPPGGLLLLPSFPPCCCCRRPDDTRPRRRGPGWGASSLLRPQGALFCWGGGWPGRGPLSMCREPAAGGGAGRRRTKEKRPAGPGGGGGARPAGGTVASHLLSDSMACWWPSSLVLRQDCKGTRTRRTRTEAPVSPAKGRSLGLEVVKSQSGACEWRQPDARGAARSTFIWSEHRESNGPPPTGRGTSKPCRAACPALQLQAEAAAAANTEGNGLTQGPISGPASAPRTQLPLLKQAGTMHPLGIKSPLEEGWGRPPRETHLATDRSIQKPALTEQLRNTIENSMAQPSVCATQVSLTNAHKPKGNSSSQYGGQVFCKN